MTGPVQRCCQLKAFPTVFDFQAGLAWITVLRKRETMRAAYAGFDPERVAAFDDADRARLLADPGVIRNRLKVNAAIENARRVLDLRATHGSFAGWLDAHHPRDLDGWRRLFRATFTFTGGEIVREFLVSTGYLTNLAVAQTLAGSFSHALVDEKSHMSPADAARVRRKARRRKAGRAG